jgi:hypothetical protein
MKKIIVIVVTFCALLIVAICMGATPEKQKDVSDEIAKLKKEVLELRERIKVLEERLEKAAIIIPDQQQPIDDFTLKAPELFRQYRFMPKKWKQKEFNGHLYYIIPINQNINQPRLLAK